MRPVLALLFVLTAITASAQTIDTTNTVFGPRQYDRYAGGPNEYTDTFSLPAGVDTPYVLYIYNGNPDGTNRASSASVLLNGVEVLTQSDLNQQVAFLTKTVSLNATNTIVVTITAQPTGFIRLGFTARDVAPPVVTISSPTNGFVTNQTSVTVSGTITDRTPVSATLNGTALSLASDGSFSQSTSLAEGANTITVSATDYFGNTASASITVIRDTQPPLLTLASPANGLITASDSLDVTGTVFDSTTVTLTVNGALVQVQANGSFSTRIALQEGSNTISVSATDAAGNTSSESRSVIKDSAPPTLTVTSPPGDIFTSQTTYNVAGTVFDSTAITLTINGQTVSVDANGSFRHTLSLVEGLNTITVIAADAAGNQSTAIRQITRDTIAPTLSVTSPPTNIYTTDTTYAIAGSVFDSTAVTVLINGIQVSVGTFGDFSQNVSLAEGQNTFTVSATDAAGNQSTVIRQITRDTIAPTLSVTSPPADIYTTDTTYAIAGTVFDSTAVTVLINGIQVSVGVLGDFSQNVSLAEGQNTFTVTATDAAGNQISIVRIIFSDTTPPSLSVSSPMDGLITNQSPTNVSGTVADASPFRLFVNGTEVSIESNGSFSHNITLAGGSNAITVEAVDTVQNSSSDTRSVIYDPTPPTLTIYSPADSSTTEDSTVTVFGAVTDSTAVTLLINGNSAALDSLGQFTAVVPVLVGENSITAQATDEAGNSATISLFITRVEDILPPDPALIAPPLDSTVIAVPISEAVSFLYLSHTPVQIGVDTSALNETCTGVIRGRVVDLTGVALPGVTVSISDHPEFGTTLSRSDGMYDMVVNGAAIYSIEFAKEGYFTSSRDVDVSCNVFAYADTVALIQPDTASTLITFSQPMELAQSSIVTDADGSRQAVLMFQQGTQVEMVLANDSVVSLSQITVRTTEYTVGPNGPNAMPGLLPPTSGYTYCANLTADEALVAGATELRFSKPVYFCVDNFIGFPVGMPVPIGIYRFTEKRWEPLEDGRVIEIVDTLNGLARLAVDAPGVIADSARLAALGISQLEQQYIATLYSAGDEIMRTPINYFGQYDKNCGIIAPEGAKSAEVSTPDLEVFDLKYPPAEPSASIRAVSSVINQALQRDVPVTGVPFSLHYTSEFQQGRKPELFIDVSGDSIPPGLKRIQVEVTVAGQLTKATLPALPNQTYHFIWDGKDAYGRTLNGEHDVAIRIGYAYNGQYQLPTYIRNNFALMSGVRIPLVVARQEITLWQKMTSTIEALDNRTLSMGGWVPSTLNALNTRSATVYYGNGQKKKLSTIGSGVQFFPKQDPGGWLNNGGFIGFDDLEWAPDGSLYVVRRQGITPGYSIIRVSSNGFVTRIAGAGTSTADSIPIGTALVSGITDLDIDRYGNIYFINDSRIRKIDLNGIVTNIAGSTAGFAGDNGPALLAKLNSPQRIAVASSGEIYISDTFNGRIRKIGTDGIISTIAGGGSTAFSEGVIARQLAVSFPQAIETGPDGSVYYAANNGFSRPGLALVSVFKLGTDGRVYLYAGLRANQPNTNPLIMPEGIFAKQADIGRINKLVVGREGLLYIVCGNATGAHTRWTYQVDGEGRIWSVIGGGRLLDYIGKPPREGFIEPGSLTFGAYGTMYFLNTAVAPPLQVAPVTLALINGKYEIPSNDGSQIFVFDEFGRHILTRDALTGKMHFTYIYDATGRLVQVMDRDSLISTIERDSTGKITAIISPKGERTVLSLDSDGMIASVSNPNEEAVQFQYAEGGLMSSAITPSGGESGILYDSTGRLISVSSAETDAQSFERIQIRDGYQLRSVSPSGTVLNTSVQQSVTGKQIFQISDSLGRTSVASINPEGVDTLRTPDGTLVIQERTYDPRFGTNVPLPGKTTTKTPGGLIVVEEQTRSVTLMAGSTPKEITDRAIINGRTFTNVYNDNSKSNTRITPENRRTITIYDSGDRPMRDSTVGLTGAQFEYDEAGRIKSIINGTRITRYYYDVNGRLSAAVDPAGNTDSLFYSETGRLTSRLFADGSRVNYQFDSNGNLVSVAPPARPSHRFDYDADNRPSRYTPPDDSTTPSGTTFYEYNLDGQLTRTTLPDSTTITNSYDPLDGTHTSTTFDRGTITFEYDLSSGSLTRIVGASQDTLEFVYDGPLRIGEQWKGIVNGQFEVKYDNSFRVIQEKVNGSDSISINYDRDDLPLKVGAFGLRYNTVNALLLSDTLDSVVSDYTYNSFAELTSITTRYASSVMFSRQYARDSLGRVTSVQETIDGDASSYRYVYDRRGRIEKTYRSDTLISEYSYDSNGNRTIHSSASGPDSGSYNSQDQLISYGGYRFKYSQNGQVGTKISAGGDSTTFAYDNFGNLVSARLPNGTNIVYSVDGANRRIVKRADGAIKQKFIYSGELKIVGQLDSADALVARFVYATKENIPDYMVSGGNRYRLASDHLGSIRLVINSQTGEIVQRLDYDEFGRVILDTNPGFQPFGFAGGLYDHQTGLLRFGGRDYDSQVGRWTAKDPEGVQGDDLNVYAYVRNDPVNFTDPEGTVAQQQLQLIQFASTVTATQRARILGRVGEIVAKVSKVKKAAESLSGLATRRFPDMFNKSLGILKEVKNTATVRWTRQMQDYVALARKYKIQLELYVREGVREAGKISPRILQLEAEGLIRIRTMQLTELNQVLMDVAADLLIL